MKRVPEKMTNQAASEPRHPTRRARTEQGQDGPQLVEPDRAALHGLTQILASGVPQELQSTSPPALIKSQANMHPPGLPTDLWTRILELLGPAGRLRAMQTCRQFHAFCKSVAASEEEQKGRSEKILGPMHQDILTSLCPDIESSAQSYGLQVESLANELSCLKLKLSGGLETSVLAGLKNGRRWKRLALDLCSPPANVSFVKELDRVLVEGNRKASLELIAHDLDRAWLEFLMSESQALTVEGVVFWNIERSDLSTACSFLREAKGLETAELGPRDASDAGAVDELLAALESGSPDLLKLSLYRPPAASESLTRVLASKTKLKSFGLSHANFQDTGLTLEALLQAAPELEHLVLNYSIFHAWSNTQCLPALRQSRLREITIDGCILQIPSVPRERRLVQTRLQHQQLLEGLGRAPCLTVLNICTDYGSPGRESRRISDGIFVEAFMKNRQASTLCLDEPCESALARKIMEHNAQRVEKGWWPVELVVKSSGAQLFLHPSPVTAEQDRKWEDGLLSSDEDTI